MRAITCTGASFLRLGEAAPVHNESWADIHRRGERFCSSSEEVTISVAKSLLMPAAGGRGKLTPAIGLPKQPFPSHPR
jgi:hypothetical protein